MLELMASTLVMNCSCIAQTNLTCDGGSVVLQGALVGTEERSGAELHDQLQDWVDAGQKIQIMGVSLEVVSCSTYPGLEESCGRTTSAPARSGIPLYAGVAGGVALLVITTAVIVAIVACRRCCRNRKYYETSRQVFAFLKYQERCVVNWLG